MAFTFSKPNKEYRDALMGIIGVIYGVTLDYFIKNSPKMIVTQLNEDKYFDHTILIEEILQIINRNKVHYQVSMFSESIENVVTKLYYCIFGENAYDLSAFIYLKKGKGWCERFFPPSDNEMYKFIVDKITNETKRQYTNPIKL